MVVHDANVLSRELAACRQPSERALEDLRLVDVEQKSTREVAELLKVSQTRVRQLIDQARAFLVGMSPAVKDEAEWNRQLHVAEALQLERLKWLYRQAMNSFQRSCGPRTVVRVTPSLMGNQETHTTTESFGETRYLQLAMRISEAMAQVPDSGLINRAYLAADAHAAGDEAIEELSEETPADINTPLDGDCSAPARQEAIAEANGNSPSSTNPKQEKVYSNPQSQQQRQTATNFTPAHPAPLPTHLPNRPR